MAASINWSTEYENQPRNVSNPGFIADSARTLKTAIRERMTLEHFFGSTESTDYGKHREGSARAFVIDEQSARTDIVTSDTYTGRIRVDLQDLSPIPDDDGTPVTGDALSARKIEVWDYNNDLITIFDPAEYVSRNQDLNITGRKVYTGDNPEVQEDLTVATYDLMSAGDKTRADEKAVGRATIKVWTDEAKDHNIFDVTDTDNNITGTTGSVTNPIDSSTNTTSDSVSANIVFANKVYGAVYS